LRRNTICAVLGRTLVPAVLCAALSGCAMLPAEEEALAPPVLKSYESAQYGLYTVRRGDVQEWKSVTVSSVAAYSEDIYFAVSGMSIDEVMVKLNDKVQAGDVLATLGRADILNEIDGLEKSLDALRTKRNNTKEMQTLDEREAQIRGTLDAVRARYADNYKALDEEEKKLTIALTDAERRLADRILVAGMDGTISSMLRTVDERNYSSSRYSSTSYSVPRLSSTTERAFAISDQTSSLFVATGEGTQYFTIGDKVEIVTPNLKFNATVIDPDSMQIRNVRADAVYFQVDEDGPELTGGTAGTVQVLLGERLNTIIVPATAVRTVGDESFVFMLEDGLRVTRPVTVGMRTSTLLEILTGLDVGEEIISGGVR